MTPQAMTKPSVFPDRQKVTAALERAAERARALAEQTGTELIVNRGANPAPKPFAARSQPT